MMLIRRQSWPPLLVIELETTFSQEPLQLFMTKTNRAGPSTEGCYRCGEMKSGIAEGRGEGLRIVQTVRVLE